MAPSIQKQSRPVKVASVVHQDSMHVHGFWTCAPFAQLKGWTRVAHEDFDITVHIMINRYDPVRRQSLGIGLSTHDFQVLHIECSSM